MRAAMGADYLEILRIPKQKAVEWQGRWAFLWLVGEGQRSGVRERCLTVIVNEGTSKG